MRRHPDDRYRSLVVASQAELAEARALIADLNQQLDRANQSAVRMARRAARAEIQRERAAA